MTPMMSLVVGWTLVGAFVFTIVITCLSLIGVVKFTNPKQQQRLFHVVILELVLGVAGQATSVLQFDPRPVASDLKSEGRNDYVFGEIEREIQAVEPGQLPPDRKRLLRLVDDIEPLDPRTKELKAELRDELGGDAGERIRDDERQRVLRVLRRER